MRTAQKIEVGDLFKAITRVYRFVYQDPLNQEKLETTRTILISPSVPQDESDKQARVFFDTRIASEKWILYMEEVPQER
jgi:hypothetical protein